MQIYHVETQEDYDALMVELEENGYKIYPKEIFKRYDGDCCIYTNEGEREHCSLEWYQEKYPEVPIEKYKAKQNGYRAEEYVSMPKEEVAKRLNDVINSPNHYTQGELEVIDILQDKLTPQEFEGFLKGNILKYTFREGIKNGTEDMKKGAWYMSRLIDFRNEQEG